jgi:hypothetical protein
MVVRHCETFFSGSIWIKASCKKREIGDSHGVAKTFVLDPSDEKRVEIDSSATERKNIYFSIHLWVVCFIAS